jgi:replicative DNA helicase
VVIDPLDAICADGLAFDDKRARLDYLSRSLKALAEELTITIIAVEK